MNKTEVIEVVAKKAVEGFDLFDVVFGSVSPYAFSILKIAFATTLYSNAIKVIRAKKGTAIGNTNPYTGMTTAFMGYLMGRGIPIIIGITDKVCDGIVKSIQGGK
jgi:hypothetical protein